VSRDVCIVGLGALLGYAVGVELRSRGEWKVELESAA
jgi:hypothetical protein